MHPLIKVNTKMANCIAQPTFSSLLITIICTNEKIAFAEMNLPAIIQIGHRSEYAAVEKKHSIASSISGRHRILCGKFVFSSSLFKWRNFLLLIVLCAIIALAVCASESREKKLLLRCRCNCEPMEEVSHTRKWNHRMCACVHGQGKRLNERKSELYHHAMDKHHTCRTIFKCSVHNTHTWAYKCLLSAYYMRRLQIFA